MKFYYIPFFICIGVVFTKCQSHVRDNNNDAHSKDNQYEKKVTIQDVDRGIRLNIDSKIKEGGGYFTFKNSDSTQLRLKLVRVHTEYLSVLEVMNSSLAWILPPRMEMYMMLISFLKAMLIKWKLPRQISISLMENLIMLGNKLLIKLGIQYR